MTIERLLAAEEVEIETRRADGSSRRTIVWIVGERRQLFVRSVRGERGRWYQEARADPAVAMWLGGERLACHARHVTDPAGIAAVSRLLAGKYAGDPSLGSMLVDEVLPTTLELLPDATPSG
jgi:hypothetical protein